MKMGWGWFLFIKFFLNAENMFFSPTILQEFLMKLSRLLFVCHVLKCGMKLWTFSGIFISYLEIFEEEDILLIQKYDDDGGGGGDGGDGDGDGDGDDSEFLHF